MSRRFISRTEIRIPTEEECADLIHQMAMLEHIIDHSRLVCRVALILTDHLLALRHDLDRDLVLASALLHDITKTRSFTTGENHARSGGEYLRDLGYPEVGEIVGQHVCLHCFEPSGPPTEAEIVNYADKRVIHDRLASLADRMDYILERYGTDPDRRRRIRWLWDETVRIESKLFRDLSFAPEAIGGFLEEKGFGEE